MPKFAVELRIEYAGPLRAPKSPDLVRAALREEVDAKMTARGFLRDPAAAAAPTSHRPDLLLVDSLVVIPYIYEGDVSPGDVMAFVAKAIGLLPFNISIQITADRATWHWIKSAPRDRSARAAHDTKRLVSAAHAGSSIADAFARILLEWCIVLRAEVAGLPSFEKDATALSHFCVLDTLIASDQVRQRLMAHARATQGSAFAEWLEDLMARGARMRLAWTGHAGN